MTSFLYRPALCWCKHLAAVVILALATTVTQYSAAATVNEKADGKPNIVFILADDQGWSDVGFNGADFYETPNIDRVAKEGMTFTDGYSGGPNCAPTRASLISGMYPPRHLIYTPGAASKGDPRLMKLNVVLDDERIKRYRLKSGERPFEVRESLEPSVVSVAEVLKQADYATARFGKWHVGDDTQGFDISSADGVVGPTTSAILYRDPDASRRITDASVNFIKDNKDENFFVFVSYWDVHKPLVANEAVVKKYENKLKNWEKNDLPYNPTYAAMVEAVDVGVGRILNILDDLDLTKETLVIYTSDNGGLNDVTINAPLRGGKGALYEGGIRVPFAMRWPGVIEAGSSTATPITSVDMLPTFADLAKVGLPAQQPVDGESIVPIIEGKSFKDRPIFWHYPLYLDGRKRQNYIPYKGGEVGKGKGWRAKPASAIRWGTWKLIEYFEDGHLELYNLAKDMSEESDVSRLFPVVTQKLLKRLQKWRKDTNAVVPKKGAPSFVTM